MSTKNIYVPPGLAQRMREFPDLNWSFIAQAAWQQAMKECESAPIRMYPVAAMSRYQQQRKDVGNEVSGRTCVDP
jgi:hypothetical protein